MLRHFLSQVTPTVLSVTTQGAKVHFYDGWQRSVPLSLLFGGMALPTWKSKDVPGKKRFQMAVPKIFLLLGAQIPPGFFAYISEAALGPTAPLGQTQKNKDRFSKRIRSQERE